MRKKINKYKNTNNKVKEETATNKKQSANKINKKHNPNNVGKNQGAKKVQSTPLKSKKNTALMEDVKKKIIFKIIDKF